jgi:hypothetical protein
MINPISSNKNQKGVKYYIATFIQNQDKLDLTPFVNSSAGQTKF